MQRRIAFAAVFLLLISALVVAGAGTSGNTSWAGNYRVMQFSAQHVMSVTVTWATGDTHGTIYCGVTSGTHYPPAASDQFAWIPEWGPTNTTGTQSYGVMCDTSAVLVATGTQPAPSDMNISPPPGGVTSTPSATAIPATNTPSSSMTPLPTASSTPIPPTATSTATPVPPTATTTATSTPTPTMVMPTATSTATTHNTCGDDPAVDQNGVSVDVWAPGLRIACGFPGYENGDNPNPPGSPLPAPRPFRFDKNVDHNEGVFGFKVFYRASGDPRGCGDVRVILHQGDAVEGRFVRFHTFQYAMAICDSAGNMRIIDVGGQTDSGGVEDQLADDGNRPMKLMGTPDDFTQRGYLFDIYYNFFDFEEPGAPYAAHINQGFANDGSGVSTFWDAADPHHLQFVCHYINGHDDYSCGHDGSQHALRDLQYEILQPSQTTWCASFDMTRAVNTVVSCGTPGSWQQRVDVGVGPVFEHEGVVHDNRVPGLQYPD